MEEVIVGQGVVCSTGSYDIGDIPVGQCPVLFCELGDVPVWQGLVIVIFGPKQ